MEIFFVCGCYGYRIICIFKVDRGYVIIFFNEFDDCVEGVYFKVYFVGELIEFF